MYPVENGFICLPTGEFVSIEEFEKRFGEHGYRFEYLFNHSNATTRWKAIFEEWKEQGILK